MTPFGFRVVIVTRVVLYRIATIRTKESACHIREVSLIISARGSTVLCIIMIIYKLYNTYNNCINAIVLIHCLFPTCFTYIYNNCINAIVRVSQRRQWLKDCLETLSSQPSETDFLKAALAVLKTQYDNQSG